MKKKMIALFILINLLLFAMCSCRGTEEYLMQEASLQDTLLLLNREQVSSKKVKQMFPSCTLWEIGKEFDAHYYKKLESVTGEITYCTVLLVEDGALQLFFDNQFHGTSLIHIQFSNLDAKSYFENCSIDTSLDSVKANDPNGYYPFLYAGYSDFPRYSHHYFSDGTVYYLQYDHTADCKVISIQKFLL